MTSQVPTQEGDIPFKVPGIDKPCFTHYKVFGDIRSGVPAVIYLHGGPGSGHYSLLTFAQLWPRYGIPCVFYDQIGCGASTHLPETAGDEELWQEQLFMDELDNLIDHLQLRDGPGFSLQGNSFGGNMVAAYATRRPKGLKRIVLASALASKELSVRGVQLCLEKLSPELQAAVKESEAKGDYDSPACKEALGLIMRNHVCVAGFPPPELVETLKTLADDRTVYTTMNGPSPLFLGKGSMRNWTVIPRLHLINVPTLVYNGDLDTSADVAQIPFFELIPNVRWRTFANAGHMVHLETPATREAVFTMVGDFLKQK